MGIEEQYYRRKHPNDDKAFAKAMLNVQHISTLEMPDYLVPAAKEPTSSTRKRSSLGGAGSSSGGGSQKRGRRSS